MPTLHDLKAEHRRVQADAQGILRNATNDNRDLTIPERRQVDAALARMTELETQLNDTQAANVRALATPSDLKVNNTMTNEMDTFLRSGSGTRHLPYTPREARFLGVGVASAGGDLTPRDFSADLYRRLEDTAPMLRLGRIIPTAGGRDLDIPIVSSFGSAANVAEGSAIAGTDPSFDVVTLGAWKTAELIQVSRELLADTGVDVQGFLAEAMAANIDAHIGPDLVSGTGSGEPTGYLYAAGTALTGGTGLAGRATYNDLVSVYGALAPKYRRNAAWLVSDSALVSLRRLTDTTGQPLWAPASSNEPESFMGRPIVVDPYLPVMGTAARSIVFGDPSAYAVRIADGGIDIEVSRDYAFDQDLVTFRGVLRMDAAPLDTDAFVSFRGGTA